MLRWHFHEWMRLFYSWAGCHCRYEPGCEGFSFFYKRKKVELELIAKITAQERVCEPSLWWKRQTDRESENGGGRRGLLVAETGGNNYPSPWQWSLIYTTSIKVSGRPTRAMLVFFIGLDRMLIIGGGEEEWKEVGESKIEVRRILYDPHGRASAVN